jgi:8-oxo-dGTP pyrophosphatase MutT (NUDIX family)
MNLERDPQREALLADLRTYGARHPDESATTARFIRFVEEHPDCFYRSLQIGHVTGSAWVVNPAGDHALFTHHRKLGAWLQLGGHADGDPNVRRVALREVMEESGLADLHLLSDQIFDLDIHPIPARPNEPAHLHYDVRYAIRAEGSTELRISSESLDLAWLPVTEVVERALDSSILRMARKWLQEQ